jgi:hypothetical protein
MVGWLYYVDENGLRVAPDFYERLRNGQTSAKRALAKADLTKRYRERYSQLTRWQAGDLTQPRLFPEMDPVPDHERMPNHVLIPFVRGGRNPPPAWLPDYVAFRSKRVTKKVQQRVANLARGPLYDGLQVNYQNGGVTAMALKPNPNFELVVVNKHDRAALHNLLAALDSASNVETWLTERMTRTGATQADALYEAYCAWCAKRGDVPTGSKSFSQALVKAGVAKLKRGKGGSRYQLELRQR